MATLHGVVGVTPATFRRIPRAPADFDIVIGVDLGSSGSEVAIGYPSGSAFNLAAAAEQVAVPGGGAKVGSQHRATCPRYGGRCDPAGRRFPPATLHCSLVPSRGGPLQVATTLLLNADAELSVREFGDDAEKTFHRLRADGVP